jgi:hypothetical protein
MDKNDPRRTPTDEELDELNEHWEEPGDPDGVFAEEQRRKWRELHPAAPLPAARKKRRWPRVIVALVLLVAATYGAYWIGDHQASTPASSQPKTVQKTQHQSAPKQPVAPPVKTYESANFHMVLDYPATWKVTDTVSKLTFASPSLQLTQADGTKTSGHVLVTVQPKQTAIARYPADGAVAVLESQKLTYTHPTPIQRAQTYLSLLSYQQSDGLDALYITGDSGYVQHQLVPLSDVLAGDPLIGASFASCSTPDCASGTVTPLTLLASSWPTASFSSQVVNLLQSIQLN